MKRCPELRSLSVQHHHGLAAARSLRQAGAGEAPLEEAAAGFLAAWEAEIRPHFRTEEEVLLPEIARSFAPDDPLIVRVLTEHVALRRAVRELGAAAPKRRRMLASEIGTALDEHIRFEERVFFPQIEKRLTTEALEALGRALAEGSAPRSPGAACGLQVGS